MAVSKEKFELALKDKHIPILILDNKWHRLFKKIGTTDEIISLEKELTDLLKRQGKLNSDVKNLKKIKSNLMQDIVDNMDGADGKDSEKKIAESKRLINESNETMMQYEDELLELPSKIDRVNRELMIESMALCYECLASNTDEIEEIANWIHSIRIELKKNIIRKQEKEFQNADLYSYMHDIFGYEVMEIFDMRYEPTLRKPEVPKENTTANGERT